jgi:hypothetical protein
VLLIGQLDYGFNQAAYYPTDPASGNLLGNTGPGFNVEGSFRAGGSYLVNQLHGAFTGVQQ